MVLAWQTFAQPWVLWMALGLAALALLGGWILEGRRHNLPEVKSALLARTARVRELPGYNQAVRKRYTFLAGAITLAMLATAIAATTAARPQSTRLLHPQNANRDIQLCLDVSGSMLDVASETLATFQKLAHGFAGERIGLTIFNAAPVQIFPLTDDYNFVRREMRRMQSSFDDQSNYPEHWAGTLSGKGSSLVGDGLAACVMGFDHTEKKRSRTVILATDNFVAGEQTVTLEQAAKYASKQRVRVFAIDPAAITDGYGADWHSDENDKRAAESELKANSAQLQAAAEATGGKAYGLLNDTAVENIIQQVQRETAMILQGQKQLVRGDGQQGWLLTLGALLALWLVVAWRVKL